MTTLAEVAAVAWRTCSYCEAYEAVVAADPGWGKTSACGWSAKGKSSGLVLRSVICAALGQSVEVDDLDWKKKMRLSILSTIMLLATSGSKFV